MTIDSSKLTKALCDRVKNLDTNNAILRMLVDRGIRNQAIAGSPRTGFESAKKMVDEGFISMIWGPPGTGKTYTLASLAMDYMAKGKRILIISQSNISVDGAILKIIDIAERNGIKDKMLGKVFRYGMAREPNLYVNEDFCARLYARNKNPEIKEALEEIEYVIHISNDWSNIQAAEKRLSAVIRYLLDRSDINKASKETLAEAEHKIKTMECSIAWLKKTAQQIRAICHCILVAEEEYYIDRASIVATTATKATITDKIKNRRWDIVFFDEVSMAFVPQIMVAATLSRERLVLLGDFRQLAPIVQFDSASILRKDIFTYLHATDGKGGVMNHPWLTMLDEQRRMHPEIASFVSKNLYSDKLHTAIDVKESVLCITENGPFENKAFAMVDHSEYQALCYTTNSGSRYNPLSAIISIKLALQALEGMDLSIGIITPYQAQARLLSAIVKDIEVAINSKLNILCSTVHQFQGFEKDLIIFDTVESESKRETGKLFVDGDFVDDATRLVNVAVTRARGKFIVVTNYRYLKEHFSGISEEMQKLLIISNNSARLYGNSLIDFLSQKSKQNTVAFYKTEIEALPDFFDSIKNGNSNRKLTFWHSARNTLRYSQNLSCNTFVEKLREAKQYWSSVGACNGKGTKHPVISKVIFPYFNPIDDYIIGEDTFAWFGLPLCQNSNYGGRLPYAIKGRNATSVFEILCGHEMARKEWTIYKKNESMSKSDFTNYLSEKFNCPQCHCGSKVHKTRNNKYIVVCKECGDCLNPFVPYETINGYMRENKIFCKECGAPLKISRYGKPYCTNDWNHNSGISLEEIFGS